MSKLPTTEVLKIAGDAYERLYNSPADATLLKGSGSDRIYVRLSSPEKPDVIGVYGNDKRENRAFIGLSRLFAERGCNVPEILWVSDDEKIYFEQDLGNEDLLSCLHTEMGRKMTSMAIAELVKVQTIPTHEWDGIVFEKPFSQRLVSRDLNYFKYCFLKPAGIIFNEDLLDDDFEKLSGMLVSGKLSPEGFMYRDFQSRNVMVYDEKPWLIDYQGGRKGPMFYDIASFAWQVKAAFDEKEKEEIIKEYLDQLSLCCNFNKEKAFEAVRLFAFFRAMQVLGAYGFRGLIQQKQHFKESIAGGIVNLEKLATEDFSDEFPEIKEISKRLSQHELAEVSKPPEKLTVTVTSFSFKNGGYPKGCHGNGGGFVFDCRGIHNPGRYDKYKPLTGKDKEVIEFFNQNDEAERFVSNAMNMVKDTISRYRERGFNSLQVSFGCTGGRHRSVFCTELFSKKVKELFPDVEVEVCHREHPSI